MEEEAAGELQLSSAKIQAAIDWVMQQPKQAIQLSQAMLTTIDVEMQKPDGMVIGRQKLRADDDGIVTDMLAQMFDEKENGKTPRKTCHDLASIVRKLQKRDHGTMRNLALFQFDPDDEAAHAIYEDDHDDHVLVRASTNSQQLQADFQQLLIVCEVRSTASPYLPLLDIRHWPMMIKVIVVMLHWIANDNSDAWTPEQKEDATTICNTTRAFKQFLGGLFHINVRLLFQHAFHPVPVNARPQRSLVLAATAGRNHDNDRQLALLELVAAQGSNTFHFGGTTNTIINHNHAPAPAADPATAKTARRLEGKLDVLIAGQRQQNEKTDRLVSTLTEARPERPAAVERQHQAAARDVRRFDINANPATTTPAPNTPGTRTTQPTAETVTSKSSDEGTPQHITAASADGNVSTPFVPRHNRKEDFMDVVPEEPVPARSSLGSEASFATASQGSHVSAVVVVVENDEPANTSGSSESEDTTESPVASGGSEDTSAPPAETPKKRWGIPGMASLFPWTKTPKKEAEDEKHGAPALTISGSVSSTPSSLASPASLASADVLVMASQDLRGAAGQHLLFAEQAREMFDQFDADRRGSLFSQDGYGFLLEGLELDGWCAKELDQLAGPSGLDRSTFIHWFATIQQEDQLGDMVFRGCHNPKAMCFLIAPMTCLLNNNKLRCLLVGLHKFLQDNEQAEPLEGSTFQALAQLAMEFDDWSIHEPLPVEALCDTLGLDMEDEPFNDGNYHCAADATRTTANNVKKELTPLFYEKNDDGENVPNALFLSYLKDARHGLFDLEGALLIPGMHHPECSELICLSCNKARLTPLFIGATIPCPLDAKDGNVSMEKLLGWWCNGKNLTEATCPHCGKWTATKEQRGIAYTQASVPSSFTIALGRTGAGVDGVAAKISAVVRMPLTLYLATDGAVLVKPPAPAWIQARYILTSFVLHVGDGEKSGHYTSIARVMAGSTECWVEYNDRLGLPISQATVEGKLASGEIHMAWYSLDQDCEKSLPVAVRMPKHELDLAESALAGKHQSSTKGAKKSSETALDTDAEPENQPRKGTWGDTFPLDKNAWQCNVCMVQNIQDDKQCLSCKACRPGYENPAATKKDDVSSSVAGWAIGAGGFVFRGDSAAPAAISSGGFEFGATATKKDDASCSVAGSTIGVEGFTFGGGSGAAASGGFSFGRAPAAGKASSAGTSASPLMPAKAPIPRVEEAASLDKENDAMDALSSEEEKAVVAAPASHTKLGKSDGDQAPTSSPSQEANVSSATDGGPIGVGSIVEIVDGQSFVGKRGMVIGSANVPGKWEVQIFKLKGGELGVRKTAKLESDLILSQPPIGTGTGHGRGRNQTVTTGTSKEPGPKKNGASGFQKKVGKTPQSKQGSQKKNVDSPSKKKTASRTQKK
eukprot:Sro2321_g323190.2  (1394) ;mRNA; r:2-5160